MRNPNPGLPQVPPKHNHAEAFMLMWFGCRCGHRERVWNSRDGVTPFSTSCPSCGDLSLTHISMGRDTYAPNHNPHHGQLVWRNGTPDEAVAIMKRRIELAHDAGAQADEAEEATLLEMVRLNAEGRVGDGNPRVFRPEFQPGWPVGERSRGGAYHAQQTK